MIALHSVMQRLRRGLILAAALLALAVAVAWAHGGMAMDHMEAAKAATVCLAIVETAGVLGLGWTRRRSCDRSPGADDDAPPALRLEGARFQLPWARAGPSELQVFRC